MELHDGRRKGTSDENLQGETIGDVIPPSIWTAGKSRVFKKKRRRSKPNWVHVRRAHPTQRMVRNIKTDQNLMPVT